MKIFLKWFAYPLLIATLASIAFVCDAIIGSVIAGASFLWVAFIVWTVFFVAKFKDRVKGLLGILIGFAIASGMMLITSSFTANLWVISVSALLGVFVGNFAAMHFEKADKFWLSSVSGIFVGMSLSFSGLGIGMSPMNGASEAFLMLGIIMIYAVLGLTLGFFSMLGKKYIDKKRQSLEMPKGNAEDASTEDVVSAEDEEVKDKNSEI
ncbi:MAG: hypothetical protein J6A28_02035 [Clostridia bacterium]|nr:hypothetical protein [Clostridia bacterium]